MTQYANHVGYNYNFCDDAFHQNWESVFTQLIGEKEGWIDCPSWISTFTNVPEYKLTFNSSNGMVHINGKISFSLHHILTKMTQTF